VIKSKELMFWKVRLVVNRGQTFPYRILYKLSKVINAKFLHRPPTVGIDGLNAYVKKQGNFFRRLTLSQKF
jgi:hypothetical protein